MRLPYALLSCVVLAASLSAQTTWIVDASNGPGTSFTSIQSAVDAAAAGDVILVRTGTYAGFSVSKGVRILGTPSFTVGSSLSFTPIQIPGVPANETFVLANAVVAPGVLFVNAPFVSVQNASGHVHLQNVQWTPAEWYVMG